MDIFELNVDRSIQYSISITRWCIQYWWPQCIQSYNFYWREHIVTVCTKAQSMTFIEKMIFLTCLTTRAVNVELAQPLETEECLTAISRFTARRGYSNTIAKDSGKKLQEQLTSWKLSWRQGSDRKRLSSEKYCLEIQPTGPQHLKEIWEILVKNARKSWFQSSTLRQLKSSLKAKVLSTTLCHEQLPNSRPLAAVSDDPEDLTALTPKRLLLGREKLSAPFMSSSGWHKDLRNLYSELKIYASSISRHYLEDMELWMSLAMETEIEVVKRIYSKPEKRLVGMASWWLFETL